MIPSAGWLRSLQSRLYHWDTAVSYRIALKADERSLSSLPYWLALFGAHLGDSWLWAIVAALLWRHARQHIPTDGGQRRRLVQAWLTSLASAIAMTLVIKQRVQRPRPSAGRWLYGGGPDIHSFPSGHAMRMGAISVWGDTVLPGWGRWAWPLALWIGWSRVRLGIHYVGDVMGGFLIGAAIGALFRKIALTKDASTRNAGA
jgi:undecaprenyl-diphosphatase